MSDSRPTDPAEEPQEPSTDPNAEVAQAGEESAEKPPRRPGPIRWWFLIVAIVLIGGGIAAAQFAIGPLATSVLRDQLHQRGMLLADSGSIDVGILSAHASADQISIIEVGYEDAGQLLAWDRVAADVGVWSWLTGSDLVIEEATIEGLTGSLRRRGDGSMPMTPPPDETPEEEEDPEAPTDTDWLAWIDWALQHSDWLPGLGGDTETAEQPTTTPPRWPEAVRYEPNAPAGIPARRVLLKRLTCSGHDFAMPDPGPLDITRFSLQANHLTDRLLPGEESAMAADLTTKAAGSASLNLRYTSQGGALALNGHNVDLKALADPSVTGDKLTDYRPSGEAEIAVNANWQGRDLIGEVVITTRQLRLDPQAGADQMWHKFAKVLEETDDVPVRFQLTIGGTLDDPQVVDTNFQSAIEDAIEEAARKRLEAEKKKLEEKAQKELDSAKKKAEQEVDKTKSEAETKAKEEQKKAEEKVDEETDKAEKKLEDEAKKLFKGL